MRFICRWYWWICKRIGPHNMTLSAYAWKTQSRWASIIDAVFVLFGQAGHCRSQFERETAALKERT